MVALNCVPIQGRVIGHLLDGHHMLVIRVGSGQRICIDPGSGGNGAWAKTGQNKNALASAQVSKSNLKIQHGVNGQVGQ